MPLAPRPLPLLMDEYICLTLIGRPGEPEAGFKGRLSTFWTHVLRTRPDDYEKVYAEATKFESSGDRVSRQYMIEAGVADVLVAELRSAGVDFEPIDADDTYTKYEASGPDWFQLDH